jgi:hypothetical protein
MAISKDPTKIEGTNARTLPTAERGSTKSNPNAGRLAALALAVTVGAGAGVATHAEEVGDTIKAGASSTWESTLGAPSDIEKLREQIDEAKANPDQVKPNKFVTFVVGQEENPTVVARALAGPDEGDFDRLVDDLQAQTDEHGNLQPGKKLIEASAVDMANEAIAEQVKPFPVAQQK